MSSFRKRGCVFLLFLIVYSVAAFDSSISWHPVQRVAIDDTATTGIDDDENTYVDYAENLYCDTATSCYLNANYASGGSAAVTIDHIGNNHIDLRLVRGSSFGFMGLNYPDDFLGFSVSDGSITTWNAFLLRANGNAEVAGNMDAVGYTEGGFDILSNDINGNAATATQLQTDGTDCNSGSFARGIDASGNSELCENSITGNAATATALSSDPANCPDGQYAKGIGTNGAAQGCAVDQTGDPDTNAQTQCPSNTFLDGDGYCRTPSEIVADGGGSGVSGNCQWIQVPTPINGWGSASCPSGYVVTGLKNHYVTGNSDAITSIQIYCCELS
ncbi:hypothetical protein K9M79_02325 [Candidatus Woesearchaeota archaeon]|nr:hypothetical protein [Candidatus Woesearchaeota archaeon]